MVTITALLLFRMAEMDVPVNKIRLGGGGARSLLWRQIQADIYGHEVEILEAEEGATYGAAIFVGVGAGIWNSVDEAYPKKPDIVSAVAGNCRQNPQS
jgi:xylulokinase